jgi:hypothetical protein
MVVRVQGVPDLRSSVYICQVLIVVVVQIDHQKHSFQEQVGRRRLDC